MNVEIRGVVIGLASAIVGGVLGCFLFLWIARQGFYALMLPGGLAGVAGGLFVKSRSIPRGVLVAIVAFIASVVSEWKYEPFIRDDSLGYFLTHLHQLQPITQLMIAGGTVFGFWFSVGRETAPATQPPPPTSPTSP